jgi:hypothetical protein
VRLVCNRSSAFNPGIIKSEKPVLDDSIDKLIAAMYTLQNFRHVELPALAEHPAVQVANPVM